MNKRQTRRHRKMLGKAESEAILKRLGPCNLPAKDAQDVSRPDGDANAARASVWSDTNEPTVPTVFGYPWLLGGSFSVPVKTPTTGETATQIAKGIWPDDALHVGDIVNVKNHTSGGVPIHEGRAKLVRIVDAAQSRWMVRFEDDGALGAVYDRHVKITDRVRKAGER